MFLEQCQIFLPNNYNFKDVVHGAKKAKLYQDPDLFLLPSYFEGLPNALIESMSYG